MSCLGLKAALDTKYPTRIVLTKLNPVKQKVLLVGDYLNGTGFHRVVAHIKNAIKDDFEIHHVGIAYYGEKFISKDGVTIYPETDVEGGKLHYKYLVRMIDELQPDIFFIAYDIVFMRFLLETFRYNSNRNMVCGAYIALDGEITKKRKMISTLKDLDFCVWYTDFAYNHVQDLLTEQPSLLPKPMDFRIIPHGVESQKFYSISKSSIEKRRKARAVIFPQLKNPEKTFIVLNANRPTPRKRIDLTIKAFAEFAKDKSSDEVKLYLHHSFCHGHFDHFTHEIIEEYNLHDYLLQSSLAQERAILTNEQLNLLYNACDVGVNTCMGEGWGLANFEHAATKAPQILPAHSCFPEIWKDSVLWITDMEKQKVMFSPHKMYEINVAQVVQHLETLYQNPELREAYGEKAYENVIQKKYDWNFIETQWNQLFHEYSNSLKLKQKAAEVAEPVFFLPN
jgi:glycosyltransferase involved in cell wall biosynthesis